MLAPTLQPRGFPLPENLAKRSIFEPPWLRRGGVTDVDTAQQLKNGTSSFPRRQAGGRAWKQGWQRGFWCSICTQGANYGGLATQRVLVRYDRYDSLGRFAMLKGTDYSARTDFPNRKRGFSDTESLDVASYTSC